MTPKPPAAPALPLRRILVVAVRPVTPRTVRVTFGGESLADLTLAGPDQQVKLYFPRPGRSEPVLPAPDRDGDLMRWYAAYAAIPEAERPWMRSYTIRVHDPGAATVDIDFYVHGGDGGRSEHGPATRWARAARPGDTLGMFGPSAYFATPVTVGAADWSLLAADGCSLPALATVAEALPPGHRAVAFVQVADATEEQPLVTAGELTVHWLHGDASPAEAVRGAALPPGTPYAWLAGEAGAVRALRRHLVKERGYDRRAVHFTGYWRRHLTQDDAPTPEDLAEARERLESAGGEAG
ncbi:siderophore-interacting protein [Streptomyces sp. P9(2023)]|uniref:siderophore-interacting protein n=1 Tax=Streptomyces sp. P9(2023) TaxID=3064394 RepID=UPI0028F3EBF7|nr:siderophore-interacting protein [Streptomyces sp. P9(2023)]MDT9693715.1 siderophore-interacting protein [Streptomyces sp. P9(2023)]